MNYSDATKKTLESIKKKIEDTINAKGLNNSGEALNSLEIDGNQLLGNDYIYYLDKGSAPWVDPTKYKSLGYILSLQGWNKYPPYAAAYSIANYGSKIFQNKSLGLQLDNIIEESIDELIKELPEVAAMEALKWL